MAARELETRHLQALEAVAEAGTFGRAAEALGYTQSAVSQQIAALERVVGAPLFDRPGGPRPVTLTPLGTVLVGHAREILARVRAAADDVDRFRAGMFDRIDIGTFQSISVAFLPSLLGQLNAEHPDLETRLLESDDEALLADRVVTGQLHVSFVLGHRRTELERTLLFDDPFVLISLPSAVGPGPVPIGALRDMPLIGQHKGDACQQRIDTGLRSAGVLPDYVFRSNDNTAVVAMVKAGMGSAVMPLLAVDVTDPAIAVRPIDPAIPHRSIHLCWRRGGTLSPAAVRFIELAKRLGGDLRDREFAIG